jgi:hypothetical protein
MCNHETTEVGLGHVCGHEVAKCNWVITTWSILVMYRHETTKVSFGHVF